MSEGRMEYNDVLAHLTEWQGRQVTVTVTDQSAGSNLAHLEGRLGAPIGGIAAAVADEGGQFPVGEGGRCFVVERYALNFATGDPWCLSIWIGNAVIEVMTDGVPA